MKLRQGASTLRMRGLTNHKDDGRHTGADAAAVDNEIKHSRRMTVASGCGLPTCHIMHP
jgi:hypothetical protein